MTPQEKAIELVNSFYNKDFENIWNVKTANYEAKQCALICVDEVYKNISYHPNYKYWQEVKQEIEQL